MRYDRQMLGFILTLSFFISQSALQRVLAFCRNSELLRVYAKRMITRHNRCSLLRFALHFGFSNRWLNAAFVHNEIRAPAVSVYFVPRTSLKGRSHIRCTALRVAALR